MGRLASVVLAVALTACVQRAVVFGERAPVGCAGSRINTEPCIAWVFDRLMLTIASHPYNDAEIAAYVSAVGERLVRASSDRRTWRFHVLDDTTVQAFAGLTTSVYINRGALVLLRSEAELAGVLGHEIGHVLGGHTSETVAGLGRRDVGHTAPFESQTLRYARDDEIQADEVAVLLLARAGYDARAVTTMLRAYAATSPTDGNDPTDNHPAWTERIARVQALAALHPGGELAERRFRERLTGLVVGDDPRVAALLGEVALFAHVGLALDLPAHRKAKLEAGAIDVELDADSILDLRVMNPEMAKLFPKQPSAGTATETIIAGKLALAISVHGPDAARRARELRALVRMPRDSELAQLRPTRVDLEAPRLLWLP